MRKLLLGTTALTVLSVGPAFADPGFMLGVSWALDGKADLSNIGLTAKILSSDREDKLVASAGVSYYPGKTEYFGLDVGAGYNYDSTSLVLSYDFLQKAPQVSLGWVNTEDKPVAEAPVAAAPPPPPPPP